MSVGAVLVVAMVVARVVGGAVGGTRVWVAPGENTTDTIAHSLLHALYSEGRHTYQQSDIT